MSNYTALKAVETLVMVANDNKLNATWIDKEILHIKQALNGLTAVMEIIKTSNQEVQASACEWLAWAQNNIKDGEILMPCGENNE